MSEKVVVTCFHVAEFSAKEKWLKLSMKPSLGRIERNAHSPVVTVRNHRGFEMQGVLRRLASPTHHLVGVRVPVFSYAVPKGTSLFTL